MTLGDTKWDYSASRDTTAAYQMPYMLPRVACEIVAKRGQETCATSGVAQPGSTGGLGSRWDEARAERRRAAWRGLVNHIR